MCSSDDALTMTHMGFLPKDHIYVLLIAFLAVLGCFTAVTLVGTDPSSVATLRDALIALGGGLTGVAVGSPKPKPDPPADS